MDSKSRGAASVAESPSTQARRLRRPLRRFGFKVAGEGRSIDGVRPRGGERGARAGAATGPRTGGVSRGRGGCIGGARGAAGGGIDDRAHSVCVGGAAGRRERWGEMRG
jgi:hypothetical protein